MMEVSDDSYEQGGERSI